MSTTDGTPIDDEIVVVIDPDLDVGTDGKAPDVRVKTGADDALLGDLKGQFANLQTTAQQAESRAQQAEREAKEANDRAKALETEVVETRKGSVDQGITSAKAEVDAAEAEYARMMEEGNFAGAAKAQRRMSESVATIQRLEEAKVDIAEPPVRKAPPERPTISWGDPIEAFVSNRTPPTAAWLRAHPDYITDPVKNARLTAAHYNTVAEGIALDTPEYFAAVEKKIGINAPTKGKRPMAPTAPAIPSGGGMDGNSGTEVRLTRGEHLAATDGTHVWTYDDPTGKSRWKKGEPIGATEFARRKLQMQKEGRYDRSMTDQ